MSSSSVVIAVIALDIDGTLVTSDGELPRQNLLAIREAARRGTVFVLTTTRTVAGAREVLDELGIPAAIVAELGATVLDIDGSILWTKTFARSEARSVIRLLVASSLDFICTANGISFESSQTVTVKSGLSRPLEQLELDYSRVSRVVVRGSTVTDVVRLLGNGFHASIYGGSTGPGREEDVVIVPFGISKGTGLRALCEHWRVDRRTVLAIGDSATDIDMFDGVHVGVAMGDGDPALLDRADWVAPPSREYGVAQALHHFGAA
jgi:5-amino-6-(5-phospho-D-ribitylamino)uracil phosphatase